MNKPAYVITRKGIKHANRRKRGREPRHGQESLSARSLKPECFFLLFALCVAIFTFLNHHNFVPTFQLLNFRRANAGPTVETQPPTALYAYDERTMRALIDIGRRSNHRANSLLYESTICYQAELKISSRQNGYKMPVDQPSSFAFLIISEVLESSAARLASTLESILLSDVKDSIPVYISFRPNNDRHLESAILEVVLRYRKKISRLHFLCKVSPGSTTGVSSSEVVIWSINHIFNGGEMQLLHINEGDVVGADVFKGYEVMVEYVLHSCPTCFGAFVGRTTRKDHHVNDQDREQSFHVIRSKRFEDGRGGSIFLKREWVSFKPHIHEFCKIGARWAAAFEHLGSGRGVIKQHVLSLMYTPLVVEHKTSRSSVRRDRVVVDHGLVFSESIEELSLNPASTLCGGATISPSIGILLGVTSRGYQHEHHNDVSATSLVKLLLPSIQKTLEHQYDYVIYLAIDNDDKYWTDKIRLQQITNDYLHSPNIFLRPIIVEGGTFVKALNEVAKIAFLDGVEYFVRINDDSEFLTYGWATEAISALMNFEPANFGVVGPTCNEGNTYILTHDFTHRKHLLAFPYGYYPPQLENAWADDWITDIYRPTYMRRLRTWKVRHHVGSHGTRYKTSAAAFKMLPLLIQNGKKSLHRFKKLQLHSSYSTSRFRPSEALFRSKESGPFHSFLNKHFSNLRNREMIEVAGRKLPNFNISRRMKSRLDWNTVEVRIEPYFIKAADTPIDPLAHRFTAPLCNTSHTMKYRGSKLKRLKSRCQSLAGIADAELVTSVSIVVLDCVDEAGASIVDDIFATWDWSSKHFYPVAWLLESCTHGHSGESKRMNDFMTQKNYRSTWFMNANAVIFHQRLSVVAFSLQYHHGLDIDSVTRNVAKLKKLYPRWTIRGYYDHSILGEFIHLMEEEGVEMYDVTHGDTTFSNPKDAWPYHTVTDPLVDSFVICDLEHLAHEDIELIDKWILSKEFRYVFFSPLETNRWGSKKRIGSTHYDVHISLHVTKFFNSNRFLNKFSNSKKVNELTAQLFENVKDSGMVLLQQEDT